MAFPFQGGKLDEFEWYWQCTCVSLFVEIVELFRALGHTSVSMVIPVVRNLEMTPRPSVRNEGGGGLTPPPPIPAQDPGICAFQGDPGWVP